MGAARDRSEAAPNCSKERLQFRKPPSGHQMTQQELVNKAMLLDLQVGRLKDAGTLEPHQISVGKLNNCREANEICQGARAMLGGDGIPLDYSPLRHANDLASVRTYEVHTRILGNQIMGTPALRSVTGSCLHTAR